MSKLLKSKFLLGLLMVVAFAFLASSADAAITSTLKYGSKGAQVIELQQGLGGLVADGSFGAKTLAAVKAWQASKGLVADGIFGAKSRAAWTGGAVSGNFPAGCTSASGFSSLTGLACNSVNANTFPAGCTSASGFSPLTGVSCATGVSNTPTGTGPVMVTLASDNPASAYVIGGQATADFAHFTFTGNGTVNTVVLQRNGVSDQNTLSSVYLYDGTVRLTDGYSFNNVGQMTINNLGLAVNGSKTISVKADVATGATASTIGVSLVSYTVSGGTATAVNVMGNQMNYGTGTLATVYLPTAASVAVPAASVNTGTSSYTVWSAPVNVGTRAVLLKGANFRMVGAAPADALSNIKLYVDGVATGSVATVGTISGSSYAMFDFSAAPVSLSTGSHTVDVRADVVKGANYDVTVSIQQAADLVLFDAQLGVNLAPRVSAGTAFSSNTAGKISINPGTASVTVDPTFQSLTNVTGGATNAVIGKFKIHGYSEDVKVTSLLVTPLVTNGGNATSDGAYHSLQNVTVYFNGSQVGSSANYTEVMGDATSNMTFNLGSQMIVPAGVDSFIEIRADLQNGNSVNYTSGSVKVYLNKATALTGNAQGQTSHSTVTFPTGEVATSGLTVQTGLLAVAANGAYTAQSISPNTANAKIGSFILQNQSSSEAVRVTSLAVSLWDGSANIAMTTGTTPALTNFSNLKTSETSGSGAIPVQPQATNTFSVDFTIAAGATKTVDVFADMGADATSATFYTKLLATSLGASSNVSISQNGDAAAVTGQVITPTAGTFGNAGVVVSASTAPQYVAAGSTGVTDATKATFNFKSVSGSATVSELKFAVKTTGDRASVNTVRVGGVTAPVVNGVAYLTGLNIAVPNGGSGVNVDAFMSYGPVGTNGNTSGDTSFVEMTYIRYTQGGTTTTLTGGQTTAVANTLLGVITSLTTPALDKTTTAVMAMADAATAAKFQPGMIVALDTIPSAGAATSIIEVQSVSGANVTVLTLYGAGTDSATYGAYFYSVPQNAAYASSVNNGIAMDKAGLTVAVGGTSGTDAMVIVGSKPTLAVVDASTQLINGSVKVGSVTVTADSKGDIAVNALPLTFTSTGNVTVAGTSLVVKNAADQSTINTTDGTLTVGAGGSGNVTVTFTGGYTVTAGQTITLDIYATAATVTGGPAANVLSMKLGAAASFTWTDVAGSATGTQTGTLLYNYPTTSSIIND